jgi:ABC-type uncharacterized transport system ATPase subunit
MTGTVAVAARGLTKSYGHRRAIERVTFEVERGQVCGLLGPNGAGKPVTELGLFIRLQGGWLNAIGRGTEGQRTGLRRFVVVAVIAWPGAGRAWRSRRRKAGAGPAAVRWRSRWRGA